MSQLLTLTSEQEKVYKFLNNGGAPYSLQVKDIISHFPRYGVKTVKYALRILRDKGLVKSNYDLMDMRRVYYTTTGVLL